MRVAKIISYSDTLVQQSAYCSAVRTFLYFQWEGLGCPTHRKYINKMLGLSLGLIFVTVLLTQRGCAQSTTASVTPLPVNASQGSVTTFHCSVTNAFALLWRVDNMCIFSG